MLAPAVQSALHRFARPWYKIRAVHVFRDQTNLSTSPSLWSSVQNALSESEYFILMASRQAAESKWVKKEVGFWLAQRSPRTLLIVLTDGEVAWDDAAGDFDWDRTSALPRELSGVFAGEPLLLDLRWARTARDLSLKNADFLAAISTLAATLHGKPKEELIGQDIRQHRLVRRLVRLTITTLALLTSIAVAAAWIAWQQRTLAISRELASTALVQVESNPELGVLLALEALETSPTEQAQQALRDAMIKASVRMEFEDAITRARSSHQATKFADESISRTRAFKVKAAEENALQVIDAATNQQVSRFDLHATHISGIDFSPDDSTVVSVDEDGVAYIWDIRTGKPVHEIRNTSTIDGFASVLWSPNGEFIVIGGFDKTAQVFETKTWRRIGSFEEQEGRVDMIAISADNTLAITASTAELYGVALDRRAYVWDLKTGKTVATMTDARREVDSIGIDADGVLALTEYTDGMIRLWDARTGATVASKDGNQFVVDPQTDKGMVEIEAGSYNISGEGLHHLEAVAFTRDGKFLITTDESGSRAWSLLSWTEWRSPASDFGDVVTGNAPALVIAKLREHSPEIVSSAFSPDAKRIAAAYGTPDVRIYRWETLAPLEELVALAKMRVSRQFTSEEREKFLH